MCVNGERFICTAADEWRFWPCPPGEVCTDGSCQEPMRECAPSSECQSTADCGYGGCCTYACECVFSDGFQLVGIRSTATNTSDLSIESPGPDIDAVSVRYEEGDVFAETIVESRQGGTGAATDPEANAFSEPAATLGPNDAIPSRGGECELSAEEQRFWSMGDDSGYIVLSFERPFYDGSYIDVWEIDDIICDNVFETRADTYEVWVAARTVTTPPGGDGWFGPLFAEYISHSVSTYVDPWDGSCP